MKDELENDIKNQPEGMTTDDIRHMSEDDLLDLDYFLNEGDVFDEDFPGAEVFLYFLKTYRLFAMPASVRATFISRVLQRRTFL